MLSPRKETILRIIIEEYIDSAAPVASESIARSYALRVSPATIRNDIARLEEEGYILRPHTSAGAVPSDRAYRYYVESLIQETELSEEEQKAIRRFFQEVEREIEEWVRLGAVLLARKLKNVAVVTLPQAKECHLRHLELVALQEFLALLILVLRETKPKRQLLTLDQKISQDELTTVVNKLNLFYSGLTSSQIHSRKGNLSPLEEEVTEAVVRVMEGEDERQYEELYLNGLRHLMSQPEFAQTNKALEILELLEEKSALGAIISSLRGSEDVRVTIGGENRERALRGCSLVVSNYGVPAEARGAIGVIGPTRMPYGRVIPTVRYLSALLSEMMSELYGWG